MDGKPEITVQVIVGEKPTMGARVRIVKDGRGGSVIEPIDTDMWLAAKNSLLQGRVRGCFTGEGNGTLSSALSLQALFGRLFQAGIIVL